jgi:hypothetical protein
LLEIQALLHFDAHISGLNLLEAEHSNAMSAKLASALASLRQVLELAPSITNSTSGDIVLGVSSIHCCNECLSGFCSG